MTFHVVLEGPGTLVVDQNFDRGWHATQGTPVSRDGLLALEIPAGDYPVSLSHRPEGFWLGLSLSILGLLLSAGFLGTTRRTTATG